jgi:hypothetical protein
MRWWIGAGAFAGMLALTLALAPLRRVLEIADADTGRVVLCAEMADGEEFVLAFVHSVNKRPVYETLRAARDHLVIVGSRFDSFGAGMPESSSGEGTLRRGADGWLEWTVNRPVPEVIVRVGRVANHTLTLKGRDIPLAALAHPGTPLSLRAEKRSILAVWKGGCLR